MKTDVWVWRNNIIFRSLNITGWVGKFQHFLVRTMLISSLQTTKKVFRFLWMKCGLLKGVIQHTVISHGQLQEECSKATYLPGKYKESLLWNGRKDKSKFRALTCWTVRVTAICLQKRLECGVEGTGESGSQFWGLSSTNQSSQVPCSAPWATLKTDWHGLWTRTGGVWLPLGRTSLRLTMSSFSI